MEVILNIGLDVNATSTIAAHVALEIVKANGFLVRKHAVVQSDTEPTLVVTVSQFDGQLAGRIYSTAVDLQQDCIAVYSPRIQNGTLIGPKAAAWGTFNPEFFFMPDGTRLASPAAKAACPHDSICYSQPLTNC